MNYSQDDAKRVLDAQTRVHCARPANGTASTIDTFANNGGNGFVQVNINGSDDDEEFEAVPHNYVRFTSIEIHCTNISGASSISWYLSRANNGLWPFTPLVTSTILLTNAAGTTGGIVALIDLPWCRIFNYTIQSTAGGGIGGNRLVAWDADSASTKRLYFNAYTNAGTVDVVPNLYFLTNEAPPALRPRIPDSIS